MDLEIMLKQPESLKELFENEEFLNLLVNSLKNAEKNETVHKATFVDTEENTRGEEENVILYSKMKCEKLSLKRLRDKIREFEKLIENLNSFLKIALETFSLQDDEPPLSFLAKAVSPKINFVATPYAGRDAQILFTVKRVVQSLSCTTDEQTIALKISSINKLCVAGRALCRLIKCFTIRLSILDASTLSHLFQFSIIVHDLLRQFLEYCVLQTTIANFTKELENLIDYFQLEVVFGLKEKRNMLLFLLQQKMKKFLTSSGDSGKKKHPKNFVYLRPTSTPKGFLMPLHLREKRQKHQPKESPPSTEQRTKLDQPKLSPKVSTSEEKKRFKLTIPDHIVTKANAYASATRNRSEANRVLFGLPIGTSTADFTEKFTEDIVDEILEEFERDLNLACEDIVDKMYEIETDYLKIKP